MIPNPWMIIAAIVFLVVSHTWAYQTGSKHKENAIKAEQLEATNKAIVDHDKQADKDQEISKEFEQVREVIKTVYVKVREKVNENIDKNPGYADCSLDDIGLRLFNENPAIETSPISKPIGGMPGADQSAGRKIIDDTTH